MDVLDNHSPKFFVLENVKNIIEHDDGNTLKKILKESKNGAIIINLINGSEINNTFIKNVLR